MVGLAKLGHDLTLNLKHIALVLHNAEYRPKKLNAVILRIKEPKTVAIIFNSGSFVCTGAKNEEDLKKAARKVGKIIKSLKYEVKLCYFKIINIVSSCDLNFRIQLNKLFLQMGHELSKNEKTAKILCHYEPEIFPGLIYRMMAPQVTFLVFKSGKINIVGAKNKEDIYKAFDKIYPLLTKFKAEESIIKNDTNKNIDNLQDFSYINNF